MLWLIEFFFGGHRKLLYMKEGAKELPEGRIFLDGVGVGGHCKRRGSKFNETWISQILLWKTLLWKLQITTFVLSPITVELTFQQKIMLIIICLARDI